MNRNTQSTSKLCAIFVTFEMNENLIINVERLVGAVPNSEVIVVDNSSPAFKQKYRLKEQLISHGIQCTYIDNDTNCRFIAYNIATKISGGKCVVFRTDDDSFDEKALANILKSESIDTFAITPHYFQDNLQWGADYQQPLESIIFNRAFLHTLLPFSTAKSGDWELLRYAFSSVSPIKLNVPLLNKAPHGR